MLQVLQLLFLYTFPVSESQDVFIKVNGLVKQSIYLSHYLHLQSPVEEVTWFFHNNGIKFKVGEFRSLQYKITNSEFSNRSEVYNNGTGLRIAELRLNDTGVFRASIILSNQNTKELFFNLTVYEPVPTPDIEMKLEGYTTDWCNFTLHCSVSKTQSMLSFSWKHRDPDLGYQPYANGSTIQLSLQPNSWGTEFLCLVQNPAHQKNASLQSQKICLAYDKKSADNRHYYYILLPVLISFCVFLPLFALVIWKKTRKESTSTALPNEHPELEYIEIVTVPRNGSNQKRPVQPLMPKTETIYTTIKKPA
ncbi:CD48 antigen-like isoform X2 [Ascaphus truei]|uniref:CD48 antigen-like isoform X2 n=1 Tax=Ascaphus truei TaxID=8439 RepID=UPI003F5A80D9